jgi:hypothetical protein
MNELEIRVAEGQIIVNMRRTRMTVTYKKGAAHLVEEPLWTRDEGSADFRARAWHAATHKAREIGWID